MSSDNSKIDRQAAINQNYRIYFVDYTCGMLTPY